MAASYQEYTRRIITMARRQDDADQAARNGVRARQVAKRLELQPEYEAVRAWQDEQIKTRGLCSEVLAEVDVKLAALDALVADAG